MTEAAPSKFLEAEPAKLAETMASKPIEAMAAKAIELSKPAMAEPLEATGLNEKVNIGDCVSETIGNCSIDYERCGIG